MPSERASYATKRVEVVAVRSSDGKLKARSAAFSLIVLKWIGTRRSRFKRWGDPN